MQLPENVSLPENTKVYVLVPGVASDETARLRSPQLVNSEKAADFQKQLITGTSDADGQKGQASSVSRPE
ncbi:MAG TPA: hypothetical protein VMM76_25985 [Pirellulaceae bacterium]|nr:hypothetical protein [Pirellulaceae bacterium]